MVLDKHNRHKWIPFAALSLFILLQGSFHTSEASEETSLAEKQFQKANEIRAQKGLHIKQLKQAASLLKAAAGVQYVEPGQKTQPNSLIGTQAMVEIHPDLYVATNTHTAALNTLSEIYMAGDQGLPYNPGAAFALTNYAASLGNSEAQRERGLQLAAGLHPPAFNASHKAAFELGERDWESALVDLFFAASMNDSLAQMALGYRYKYGLGVQKNCSAALLYYKEVAEAVVSLAEHSTLFPKAEPVHLLSEQRERPGMPSKEQEVLHYQWFADMGYVDAQRLVGRLLSQAGDHSAEKGLRYIRQAAQAGDAEAQAQIGHMYASGLGVPASNQTAIKWFRKGSDGGSASAKFGLGFMYLQGHGLPQDPRTALKYLVGAAEQGHPDAIFHMGMMYVTGVGLAADVQKAQNFMAMAGSLGHLLAQYNLALLLLESRETCELAVSRLKLVAERGPWVSLLHTSFHQYMNGKPDLALLGYLKASELGYEEAQANAAWILSQNQGLLPGQSATNYVRPGSEPSLAASARIRAHQRAAQQGNMLSMLALGDAYYYSRGLSRDWSMAFKVYSSAAQHRSGQAYYNLGFMHEYGAGVTADLDLAKRNYDQAMDVMPGAYVPIQAALFSLGLHRRWNIVRPYLPSVLDRIWDRVYSLQTTTGISQPAASYLPKFSFGSIDFDLLQLQRFWSLSYWDPHGVWVTDSELWETCLLLALLGCLWLILWRRMSLRSSHQRRQASSPPPPGDGAMASSPSQQAVPEPSAAQAPPNVSAAANNNETPADRSGSHEDQQGPNASNGQPDESLSRIDDTARKRREDIAENAVKVKQKQCFPYQGQGVLEDRQFGLSCYTGKRRQQGEQPLHVQECC